MCYITNGDHVFVVLNRAKSSLIHRPETWGDEAVICDPWSNQVYPVAMLPSRLKNFFRGKYLDVNFIEAYNKNIHVLDTMGHYNTTFLREAQKKHGSTEYLIWHFKDKLIKLLQLLREHTTQLKTELQRLHSQYGDEDAKVMIMRAKISEINHESRNIVNECNQLIHDARHMRFPVANKLFNAQSKKTHHKIETIIQFSPEEQAILFQHRGSQFKTDLMTFFKVKPQTQTVIDGILAKTTQSLSRKLK